MSSSGAIGGRARTGMRAAALALLMLGSLLWSGCFSVVLSVRVEPDGSGVAVQSLLLPDVIDTGDGPEPITAEDVSGLLAAAPAGVVARPVAGDGVVGAEYEVGWTDPAGFAQALALLSQIQVSTDEAPLALATYSGARLDPIDDGWSLGFTASAAGLAQLRAAGTAITAEEIAEIGNEFGEALAFGLLGEADGDGAPADVTAEDRAAAAAVHELAERASLTVQAALPGDSAFTNNADEASGGVLSWRVPLGGAAERVISADAVGGGAPVPLPAASAAAAADLTPPAGAPGPDTVRTGGDADDDAGGLASAILGGDAEPPEPGHAAAAAGAAAAAVGATLLVSVLIQTIGAGAAAGAGAAPAAAATTTGAGDSGYQRTDTLNTQEIPLPADWEPGIDTRAPEATRPAPPDSPATRPLGPDSPELAPEMPGPLPTQPLGPDSPELAPEMPGPLPTQPLGPDSPELAPEMPGPLPDAPRADPTQPLGPDSPELAPEMPGPLPDAPRADPTQPLGPDSPELAPEMPGPLPDAPRADPTQPLGPDSPELAPEMPGPLPDAPDAARTAADAAGTGPRFVGTLTGVLDVNGFQSAVQEHLAAGRSLEEALSRSLAGHLAGNEISNVTNGVTDMRGTLAASGLLPGGLSNLLPDQMASNAVGTGIDALSTFSEGAGHLVETGELGDAFERFRDQLAARPGADPWSGYARLSEFLDEELALGDPGHAAVTLGDIGAQALDDAEGFRQAVANGDHGTMLSGWNDAFAVAADVAYTDDLAADAGQFVEDVRTIGRVAADAFTGGDQYGGFGDEFWTDLADQNNRMVRGIPVVGTIFDGYAEIGSGLETQGLSGFSTEMYEGASALSDEVATALRERGEALGRYLRGW